MTSLARRAGLLALTVGLAVVLFVLGGVLLGGGEAEPEPGTSEAAVAAANAEPGSVEALQARLEAVPGDWVGWATLGSVYVEQARASGDPSSYPRAEKAFAESLRIRPEANAAALTGQSALAAARHDFTRAADLAEQAVAVNAFDANAYGVLTDARVELGRYDDAEASLQQMADVNPDYSAMVRISYLRELRGDLAGAVTMMEQARQNAPNPAGAAFAGFYLGELAFNAGDLDTAERHYDEALARDPSYLQAVAGQAKVAAARGDLAQAETSYRRVVEALPLPQYATELGDLLAAQGRQQEADEQYAVVEAEVALIEANGGSADLEAALFAADHGDAAEALELAEREHQVRQSIFTDDALAWALHVNGRDAEALPLAQSALRLGTRNASFHFHLGMILSALGQTDAARTSLQTALDINPYFSVLHAPTAQAELARLGAQG